MRYGFSLPPLDIEKITYYFILYETYRIHDFDLHKGSRTCF
jgi:hypothetical protein